MLKIKLTRFLLIAFSITVVISSIGITKTISNSLKNYAQHDNIQTGQTYTLCCVAADDGESATNQCYEKVGHLGSNKQPHSVHLPGPDGYCPVEIPIANGTSIKGQSNQTDCNSESWSNVSAWSPCSKICGGGTQTMTQINECGTTKKLSRSCNNQACTIPQIQTDLSYLILYESDIICGLESATKESKIIVNLVDFQSTYVLQYRLTGANTTSWKKLKVSENKAELALKDINFKPGTTNFEFRVITDGKSLASHTVTLEISTDITSQACSSVASTVTLNLLGSQSGKVCGIGSAIKDDGIQISVTNWNTGYKIQGRNYVAGGSFNEWFILPNPEITGSTGALLISNSKNTPSGQAGWEIRVIDSAGYAVSNVASISYEVINDESDPVCSEDTSIEPQLMSVGFETTQTNNDQNVGTCPVVTADRSRNNGNSSLQIIKWSYVPSATQYRVTGYRLVSGNFVAYTPYLLPNVSTNYGPEIFLEILQTQNIVKYTTYATQQNTYAYLVEALDASNKVIGSTNKVISGHTCTFTVDLSSITNNASTITNISIISTENPTLNLLTEQKAFLANRLVLNKSVISSADFFDLENNLMQISFGHLAQAPNYSQTIGNLSSNISNGSYSWNSFNTTNLPDGDSAIRFRAVDGIVGQPDLNNIVTYDLPIIIDNTPPTITSINPIFPVIVTDQSITVSANISDNIGLRDYVFDLNHHSVSDCSEAVFDNTVLQNQVYSCTFDLTSLTPGDYSIQLSAFDKAGNVTKSIVRFTYTPNENEETPPLSVSIVSSNGLIQTVPAVTSLTAVTQNAAGNVSYSWSGSCNGTQQTITLSMPSPNIYHCSAIAQDQAGRVASSTIILVGNQSLNAVPNLSVVIISSQSLNVEAPTSSVMSLNIQNGSGTYSYIWGGSCMGTSNTSTLTMNDPGTYICTVSVVDLITSQTATATLNVVATARQATNEQNTEAINTSSQFSGGGEASELNSSKIYDKNNSSNDSNVLGQSSCVLQEEKVISGKVFVDENKNGIFDKGEKKLKGIQVKLNTTVDTVIAVSVTNHDGRYSFSSCPAKYSLRLEKTDIPKDYVLASSETIDIVLENDDLDNIDFAVITSDAGVLTGFNWWLCLIPVFLLLLILGLAILITMLNRSDDSGEQITYNLQSEFNKNKQEA